MRESEERFRTIFDFIPDAICLNRLDDLTFVGVNRTFFPSSGYTEEEVIGKTPEDLNMFYDLKDLSEVLDGLESEGQISNLEIKLRAANGSLVIALISSVLINIGEVTHVLTIAKDISELKYAHEERLRLATAVEQASEGVAITDVEGNIVYVNPAFRTMTGYSSDELVEQNPRILKSGQHDDEFYRDLWKTITSGQVWKGRLLNKAKNGTLFYEDATISPLKDSTGKIVNFVAVKRDVTENVELSRQLAHSQKMEAIGTLAGGIAHDFNNILFAMLGYTEMAQGEVSPESTAGRHLKHVMDSGKRATDMVRQILYFSHQSQPEWGPIAIGSIVKEGLKFLRSSIPTTIEIRQNIEKDLPNIIGDPTQIHQILMNFCTNAAHAMKDKIGVITVEVSEAVSKTDFTKLHPPLLPGKFVKLVVSDTGHGIPTEIIDQIFDPYFTTKPIGEGTGLGLSIVHGIIKSHGGALAVESQPGKGTSFIVFLPTIEEIRQTEENKQQKNLPRGTEHILVVDDEEMIKSLIEEMLTSLGYRVTSTTSAVEALEIYRSKPDQFSLVMTDFTMPLMTGVDLAREMLAIKQDIPIFMCTGFSHVIEDGDLERWGIRSIIRKPILLFEIAKTVREVLDKS